MARDGSIAADQLKSFVERVERLEEDRRNLATDIKDVYSEAKATGFDVKTMRTVVRLRRMTPADRQEADFLLDTYKAALGM
ncbi:MAG: DUF2312 domain-containing protein [Alphaproteobacteria bacterium]